jgi:glycolate oxidase FAD binding subunit
MNLQPTTPPEVQQAVRTHAGLVPRGGGTKAALSTPPAGSLGLDLSGLSGIVEYEPDEFTFTALAGTPLRQVESLLAEHGQYLPFDPLLVQHGATLGGTVAANTSGPGRYRFGGVRDFLLGLRFVDGAGNLVRGGGKVVKNSAGFDLPRLLVGSLGRLGIVVELTFKVFPGPAGYATLKIDYTTLDEALVALSRLATSHLECLAVDLEPTRKEDGATVWVRLGGLPEAMPARLERLREFLAGGQTIQGPEENSLWQQVRELAWVPPGWLLLKIPLTPRRIPPLAAQLRQRQAHCRYSVGGNLAWLAWSPEEGIDSLNDLLAALNLAGLVLFGPPGRPYVGAYAGGLLASRVKQALDPAGRFLEVA